MKVAPPPTTVRTLLGEKTLRVSLSCLPTLLRYSADPVRLVVHEDGTLSESGRDAIHRALPDTAIVDRATADEQVEAELAHYPMCRAARASCPLYLKLIDVALLEPGELYYCDSDVLCLRPFSGLFSPAESPFRSCFMTDVKHAYSVRPWHLRPLGGLRLAGRVNTGLIRASRGLLQLDLIEWLLKRLANSPVWPRRWYWNEQTCWAALAGQGSCGLWDRRRAILASADMSNFNEDAAIVHFVSTYRQHLDAFVNRGKPESTLPVTIGSSATGSAGPLGQFASDLRARMGW